MSPYNYVENDPIRLTDPDGMDPGDGQEQMDEQGRQFQQESDDRVAKARQQQQAQKKNDKKPEKQSGGFFSELTKHYTGPLEATMTSEQRAEYFKESAKADAWIMGGEALSLLKIGRLFPWMARMLGLTEEVATIGYTTVGRWMSASEYATMVKTGQMIEGAGGQTFVATGGSEAFTAAAKGSVYAEFEVATTSLLKGGKEGWFKVIGPSASKAMQAMLEKQGGELLPQIKNLSKILKVK